MNYSVLIETEKIYQRHNLVSEKEDSGRDNTFICLTSTSMKMKICQFEIFSFVDSYFFK